MPGFLLFVDIFSVTDRNDCHDNFIVVNFIDDPVITNPYTIGIFALELFISVWSRIIGKAGNRGFNNRYNLFIQLHYLLLGVSLNENCILHFTVSSISLNACSKGMALPL